MAKILFICYGNVARSQMAEAYYNAVTKTVDAISAGVDPLVPQRYTSPVAEVITVMKEVGIDVLMQKPKMVTPEMVTEVEQIYVLTNPLDCPEYILKLPKTNVTPIEDPFGTSLENYRLIRDQVKNLVMSIID